MFLRMLICASFLITIACSSVHRSPLDKKTIDDITETVFRYQFGGSKADMYCIGVDRDADPSNELLKRFAKHIPPVAKVSDCEISNDRLDAQFRDTKTGKRIVFYTVHSVKQNTLGKIVAEASWGRAPLWGESHRYTLRYTRGKWIVTDDELISVA
jgi:hypothetical protein